MRQPSVPMARLHGFHIANTGAVDELIRPRRFRARLNVLIEAIVHRPVRLSIDRAAIDEPHSHRILRVEMAAFHSETRMWRGIGKSIVTGIIGRAANEVAILRLIRKTCLGWAGSEKSHETAAIGNTVGNTAVDCAISEFYADGIALKAVGTQDRATAIAVRTGKINSLIDVGNFRIDDDELKIAAGRNASRVARREAAAGVAGQIGNDWGLHEAIAVAVKKDRLENVVRRRTGIVSPVMPVEIGIFAAARVPDGDQAVLPVAEHFHVANDVI